jgi:5-(carboxyamino)imidazole ribonucleotide mutase
MSESSSPVVGVVMGSDSDWPKIKGVADVLDEFKVPYEVRVISAHRAPEAVRQYATMAAARGLRIIIAAAGGAAHLAGVVASHTIVPVIGIPVPTDLQGGLDSLLSTVQMPGDVPVATVGVGSGGARNAGLLAVQILAIYDADLQGLFVDFRRKLADKVNAKNVALQTALRKEGRPFLASLRAAACMACADRRGCGPNPQFPIPNQLL